MYDPADILEAAHTIRPLLSQLLDADLAQAIDRQLAALLNCSDLTDSAKAEQLLAILDSHLSTQAWLDQFLNLPIQKGVSLPQFPPPVSDISNGDIPNGGVAKGIERSPDVDNAVADDDGFENLEKLVCDQPPQFVPKRSPDDSDFRGRGLPPGPTLDLVRPSQLEPASSDRPAPRVSCYVGAEMDQQVVVQRATTVAVTLSKDQITLTDQATSKSQAMTIDQSQGLIVQVIPKVNFVVIGSDRVEIDPTSLEQQQQLYFDVKPTDLGEGEIWVIVRQTQLPLVTLKLTPEIVASKAELGQAKISSPVVAAPIPVSTAPPHQLRITEQRNGNQITYKYELSSSVLGLLSQHESKPIVGDRQQYIDGLYQAIESRWLGADSDIEAFTADLRALGAQLWDELIPTDLQQHLWNHRDSLQSILVISEEPFIPWELVHLKPPGQSFLPPGTCFLGQMGLVRWLYNIGFPPDVLTLRRDRCRYIIPHYPPATGYRLPQAEQEVEFLERIFQATAIEPHPNPVRRALQTDAIDLLHFAGHGQAKAGEVGNAKLLLEGRIENGNYVSTFLDANTVRSYCQFKANQQQPIVVLNACQVGRTGYALTGTSGFAQAFLSAGAAVFVSSLWSVGDRPARIFSETLYTALIGGHTLAEATRQARDAAQTTGSATWLAFTVYGHPQLTLTLSP